MDLYRTDYSTLNRVFGWYIGIRCRKPTQTHRATPAWAEGFGPPRLLLLDICFFPNVPGGYAVAKRRYSTSTGKR